MPATYRAVMLLSRGGLDRLQEVSVPLVEPGPGELRVRVIASGAGSTDLTMRKGRYPFAPPYPFVPGYEVLGVVDALGAGVTGFARGARSWGCVHHSDRGVRDQLRRVDRVAT